MATAPPPGPEPHGARPARTALPPKSDTLIFVPDVSATHAARHFADLLDAVEHRGERYTIVRRGRAVAHLEPVGRGLGGEVKERLRRLRPDRAWADELTALRGLVELEHRP